MWKSAGTDAPGHWDVQRPVLAPRWDRLTGLSWLSPGLKARSAISGTPGSFRHSQPHLRRVWREGVVRVFIDSFPSVEVAWIIHHLPPEPRLCCHQRFASSPGPGRSEIMPTSPWEPSVSGSTGQDCPPGVPAGRKRNLCPVEDDSDLVCPGLSEDRKSVV